MKTLLSFLALAGLLAGGAYARAAQLSGTWTGSFDYEGSSVALSFHLTESGDALTGDIEGLPTTPTPIHDGHLAGNKVTFWANTDYEGQTYKLLFTGQLDNSAQQISFTLATDDGSWSTQVLAHKGEQAAATSQNTAAPPAPAPPNVTGSWKGSFEFQGSAVPVTMQLQDAGDTVTGTVTGMLQDAPQKPIDLHDGKLQADKLTFWLDVDYQGQTYKIVYTGTVAGNSIQFDFGTDDGSWSSNMTVTRAAGQ